MKTWILCIIILIAVVFYLQEKRNYNRAPKIIWTYWDHPDRIPKTVQMCMKGWAKWNPDYKIILLTKKNYMSYVTIPEHIRDHPNFHDMPARFADLVRIWTLAEHGGVWIDSSILLKAPLDDWLFPKYAEFSGFYIDSFTKSPNYPVIENWFFACNKGCKFLELWRDEFSQISQYPSVADYVESRKKAGVDVEKINGPVYLAMHVAAQKILQLDRYPIDQMILQKAEDGPFRYLVAAKWDSHKAVELACQDRSYQTPIMKMRGGERNALEEKILGELSEERCGWLE